MEAKELMIGDWVLYDGEPYQIRQLGICGVNRDGEDYPAVCVGKPKGIGLIIERNEIEPIPLTEEILEKNFERDEKRFINCNEFRDIEITEYNDGMWQVVIDEIEMSDLPTWKMYVCDVHQLQHALKLFGITKDITL